ncbi:MAG: HAD family hydrolase [Ghiorsea sp.]|nr:HAD family hydrolase [Ghiorsea sp.]MDQ6980989.1 HAD family hydrolase [Ghiorsea sp.]MDQ7057657.1 HAD family hydrolase [Ghiorsea sp.]
MMGKPMFKGVLLDLDGTLIDAFAPIIRAMRETLQHFELPEMSDDAIRRHTGRGDCSMTALFGDKKEQAAQYFIQVHDQTYLNDIQIMQGAETLMQWLQAKHIPMAVVTSKGQHRAEAQLEKLGWLPYFTCIIGKLEGRASKPSPEPLLLASEHMHVNIRDVVMVGDGEADMKAAYRAGCVGLGLTHSFSEEELLSVGASQCFTSLGDVVGWMQGEIR